MAGAGRRSTERAALQLRPENAVLLHPVLDDLLCVVVDPSSGGHEHQRRGERSAVIGRS